MEGAAAAAARTRSGGWPSMAVSRSRVSPQPRDRLDERARVGMGGRVEDLPHRARLDHAPGVHDGHLVAHLGHDAEVVGDEDQRQAVLALQVAQQVQVLGLDGDVEARRRLVGDEQPRLARDARWRRRCAGACRPTSGAGTRARALAAPGCAPARSRPARARQRAAPAWRARGRGAAPTTWSPMVKSGFSEAIGSCRIIAMRLPRMRRISRRRLGQQVLALEADLAAHDARGRRQQPQDREREGRLARARLADDAERLAGVEREARRRRPRGVTRVPRALT